MCINYPISFRWDFFSLIQIVGHSVVGLPVPPQRDEWWPLKYIVPLPVSNSFFFFFLVLEVSIEQCQYMPHLREWFSIRLEKSGEHPFALLARNKLKQISIKSERERKKLNSAIQTAFGGFLTLFLLDSILHPLILFHRMSHRSFRLFRFPKFPSIC